MDYLGMTYRSTQNERMHGMAEKNVERAVEPIRHMSSSTKYGGVASSTTCL